MAAISRLRLAHPAGKTAIWIGPGALEQAAADVAAWVRGRSVFVVTSAPVRRLHRDKLDEALADAARVLDLEVPDGEAAKVPDVSLDLWGRLLEAGGKRDSRVLALGGGSVGDLAGFVAGCFLRGVEYVQVPTTLLAQVDAAIGGKTGINLPEGKNMVGLFHHPRLVVADTGVLATLPAEELRQAAFEVVKSAILGDPVLFELLEEGIEELLAGKPDRLAEAVKRAARVKVEIVAQDPDERNRRRLLNLGHTLGHAIETVAGHGIVRHGDAVGHGMLFAMELAAEHGLSADESGRMRELILRATPAALPVLDPADLVEAMTRDKKAREDGLAWVLPAAVGRARVVSTVSTERVQELLARYLDGAVQ